MGIIIGALIFSAFLLAGGKDIANQALPNLKKFKAELGSGITKRTSDVRNKMSGDKTNG